MCVRKRVMVEYIMPMTELWGEWKKRMKGSKSGRRSQLNEARRSFIMAKKMSRTLSEATSVTFLLDKASSWRACLPTILLPFSFFDSV